MQGLGLGIRSSYLCRGIALCPRLYILCCFVLVFQRTVLGNLRNVQGPFEKMVDWRQFAAVMQRKAVTVMPSCGGGVT
jgi:hypothetical protein